MQQIKANFDYNPHPAQQQVHDSEARFRVINHGVRAGGSRCAMMDGVESFIELLREDRPEYMQPAVYWWLVAPSPLTAHQMWREIKHYVPSEITAEVSDEYKTIETIGGGLIEVKCGNNPDDLIGVGLDLVTVDCASHFSDLETAWGNIEARLNSPGRGANGTGGKAIIVSSGKKSKYFKKMFDWGNPDVSIYDPDWESFTVTTWDNPGMAARRNEVNPRTGITFEEGLRRRIGTDTYREQYLAEFL